MRSSNDSMGTVMVPDEALWGASTQRALGNAPISGRTLPRGLIRALGLVKYAAAVANEELGLLPTAKSLLIRQAAQEIAQGRHDAQFPLDVFQSGSGTSTNTNANEVIVRRAAQLAQGQEPALHPNDDVNLGQSSNDVMPTALHVGLALALRGELAPVMEELAHVLAQKADHFADVLKIGRTHLMDATPLTLGQEFSAYATQAQKAGERIARAVEILQELAIGGTAVGTGMNTHPGFAPKVCRILKMETGLSFHEARNHFEAQGARDDCVEVAGQLAAVAASLGKIANDIRLLASGPHAGLAELHLAALQPGSSIMPGKVNPVLSEVLVQVVLYVHGLTQTVNACGRDGHLELNATLPLMAQCLHESITCLANATRVFTEKCLRSLEADKERCLSLLESSLMVSTALTPYIGYDMTAKIVLEAKATGQSIRETILEHQLIDEDILERILDPHTMLNPHAIYPATTGAAEKVWENEGGHLNTSALAC